jgi:DNA-binding CsgD family transcriptional regulator
MFAELHKNLIQQGLSHREAEVAAAVSEGSSNKEVANKLFVTEKTIKFHLTNIYKKMKVKSRTQLIVFVAQWKSGDFIEQQQKPILPEMPMHRLDILPTGGKGNGDVGL